MVDRLGAIENRRRHGVEISGESVGQTVESLELERSVRLDPGACGIVDPPVETLRVVARLLRRVSVFEVLAVCHNRYAIPLLNRFRGAIVSPPSAVMEDGSRRINFVFVFYRLNAILH